MPATQVREVAAAQRLENVRYAIRDLACVAAEVAKKGHKILPLNIGDPINFDFQTPTHLIEAVYQAMKDGKNGYAASPGVVEGVARGCTEGCRFCQAGMIYRPVRERDPVARRRSSRFNPRSRIIFSGKRLTRYE